LKTKASLLLAFFILQSLLKAAVFQNLDFESASVPDIPLNQSGGLVSVSAGLPGWTLDVGGLQINEILHNDYSIGSSIASILGPNSPSLAILDGHYTALLTAGTPTDISLSQIGFVPGNTRSIVFEARSASGLFAVSIGGSAIPVFPLQTTSSYTLYAGDTEQFAGQTRELRFSAISTFSQGGGINPLFLDSIQFSPMPVPEPSTFAILTLIGAFGVGWQLRKKSKGS